jgi:hypothetical protein
MVRRMLLRWPPPPRQKEWVGRPPVAGASCCLAASQWCLSLRSKMDKERRRASGC